MTPNYFENIESRVEIIEKKSPVDFLQPVQLIHLIWREML